jgi:hypothetical protein
MVVPMAFPVAAAILWRFFAGLLPYTMTTIVVVGGWIILFEEQDVSETTTNIGGWLIHGAIICDAGRILAAFGGVVWRKIIEIYRRRAWGGSPHSTRPSAPI